MTNALYSTGAPEASVRAAIDEEEAHTAAKGRALVHAERAVSLALAYGRLDEANALTEDWQRVVFDSADVGTPRLWVYWLRVSLDVELGLVPRARARALAFSAEARTWPRTDFFDAEASSIFLESLAGVLNADDRSPRRARVLAGQDDSYGTPTRRWMNGYAFTSFTPSEGIEALRHLPPTGISQPEHVNARDDYNVGRVFALGDSLAAARESLARASRSCVFDEAIYRIQSELALAHLSEPNRPDACPLYLDIVRRWGHSASSRTGRAARARAQALQCPLQ